MVYPILHGKCIEPRIIIMSNDEKVKGLSGITFRLIHVSGGGQILVVFSLTGHRVQFVALTENRDPVEVVPPEILFGYSA